MVVNTLGVGEGKAFTVRTGKKCLEKEQYFPKRVGRGFSLRAGGQVFICGDQGKVGDFEDEIGCFIDMCALWG